MYASVALCVLIASFAGADTARDPRVFEFKRFQVFPTQINCYDVPTMKFVETQGIRTPRYLEYTRMKNDETVPGDTSLQLEESRRRFDRLPKEHEDIVREHAKLVQDINGLSQIIFYAPPSDEPVDYGDSIYHEIIDTQTTVAAIPLTSTQRPRAVHSGIPIILAGGASKSRPVRTQPPARNRQTINLIGSSSSPKVVTKTPYSFVKPTTMPQYTFAAKVTTTPTPMVICMPVLGTRQPTLWERLVSFFPRLV